MKDTQKELELRADDARLRCMEVIDRELGKLKSKEERELLYDTLMDTLQVEREANLS